MISERDHQKFTAMIDDGQSFVLVTHIHPDGDALGSEIGLARYLKQRGKQVRIVNNDPTACILHFIEDPELPVSVYDPAEHDRLLESADRIVLVDNSAPDRLGRLEPVMRRLAANVFCIDHHPDRDAPWPHDIVDVEACATAVMIFELTRAAGGTIDDRAALALYVGLATDTGFFRFNSTNSRGHTAAAELLRSGVKPAQVFRAIHERNSEAYTRLLGHALVGMELDADGAIASVRITRERIDSLGAGDVDTSEITSALLAMDGVRVALLFRDLPDGRIKVSLRSKGAIDVHGLATGFGGGGHRNASGIVAEGGLDAVAAEVRSRAVALVAETSRRS